MGLDGSQRTCGQSSGTRGGGSLPRIVGMMPVTISSSTTPKLRWQADNSSEMCSREPPGVVFVLNSTTEDRATAAGLPEYV